MRLYVDNTVRLVFETYDVKGVAAVPSELLIAYEAAILGYRSTLNVISLYLVFLRT